MLKAKTNIQLSILPILLDWMYGC